MLAARTATNFDIMRHKLWQFKSNLSRGLKQKTENISQLQLSLFIEANQIRVLHSLSISLSLLQSRASATSSKGNNLYNETDFKFVMCTPQARIVLGNYPGSRFVRVPGSSQKQQL